MGGDFYPHGKPGYYSYTTKFLSVGHDYSGASYIHTLYPGLYDINHHLIVDRALANLQSLINAARASEVAFISDTGIALEDPNASNVFRSINEILNSKDTFERGMQYMKSIASSGKGMKKDEMYRDVSRYFGTYLRQTLEEELKGITGPNILKLTPKQIESLINQIIGNALVKTYEQVQDFIDKDGSIRGKFNATGKGKSAPTATEEEKRAVNDMIEIVRKLQMTKAFGKYGHLFDLDVNSLSQMAGRYKDKVSINRKKFREAQVDANFGGNILELITTLVASEIGNINIANSGLTITGVHTGQMNNMKADSMLFVGKGEINIDDYLNYIDNSPYDSVRMQNIDAMDKYLKTLGDNLKHVIMISDKNYSIKAGFNGVNAQEKMNLYNIGGMLGQFGITDTIELINYLANCGPEMVQGPVSADIRTELQTLIGYFLFDHLEINFTGRRPGPNVVNLMNVSGIYIPLSTYLESVYNAIQDAIANPSSFVSVSISLGGETEQSEWTPETWGKFRESHEKETYISYRILKNIADFISAL